MICTICSNPCKGWKFRYRGDIYCRSCFHEHFELLKCIKCEKNKYIHYKTKPYPVCKICLIKDKPCIRCHREIIHFGRITKFGPVCASCNKYFVEAKICRTCGKTSKDVWMRASNEEKSLGLLCKSCYDKTLLICIKCRRPRKDCTLNKDKKLVCKLCLESTRICRQCGQPFPAGRGRICHKCSSVNGLQKKVAFAKGALSTMTVELFESFSCYLLKKRGAKFASHRILYFFPFFQKLDTLIENYEKFPSFEQIIEHFSVIYTRKYLTAMQFFEEEDLIERNKEIQELYSNLDMIERYLNIFPNGTRFHQIIKDYYCFLEKKYTEGKIVARTIRLSLTPAVKFLQYCKLFKEEITQTVLDGYLWCIPGQRNTMSGFVSFYNKAYTTSLSLSTKKKDSKEIFLKKSNKSQKRSEQLFITMIRTLQKQSEYSGKYNKEKVLRIAIEYLHAIHVPNKGVMLSFLAIKQREGEYFIRFAGREFYLPDEVIEITNTSE